MKSFFLILKFSLCVGSSFSFAMEESSETTQSQNNSSLILMSQKLCQRIIQETSKVIENPSPLLQRQENSEEILEYNKTARSFLKFLTQQNLQPQKTQPPSLTYPKTALEEDEIKSLGNTKKVRVLQYTPEIKEDSISFGNFLSYSPCSQHHLKSPKPLSLLEEDSYLSEDEENQELHSQKEAENKKLPTKTEREFVKNWRVLLSVKLQNIAYDTLGGLCLKDYPGVSGTFDNFECSSLKNIREIFIEKLGKEDTKSGQYKIKNNKALISFIQYTKSIYSDFDQFLHSLIAVDTSYSLLFTDHQSKNEEMNTYVASKECQDWLKDRIQIIFRKNNFSYLKSIKEQKQILNRYLVEKLP